MISTIAFNTFKEAIRQKFILFSLLIALCLILASKYLLRLDIGHEQLKFVFDFSSGALNFFGCMIAVISTCSLVSSEIENKTIITLLSKSASTTDFVCGKLLGIALALAVFTVLIFVATCFMLCYTASTMENASVNYLSFALYCSIQWLKLCMCSGVSIVICSLSRSFLFSVAVSFMCIVICVMGEAIADLGGKGNISLHIAVWLLPDFQFLDVADAYAKNLLTIKDSILLGGYALIYIVVSALLSSWMFSRRDF